MKKRENCEGRPEEENEYFRQKKYEQRYEAENGRLGLPWVVGLVRGWSTKRGGRVKLEDQRQTLKPNFR